MYFSINLTKNLKNFLSHFPFIFRSCLQLKSTLGLDVKSRTVEAKV